MRGLDLAVVGNCAWGGLIDAPGAAGLGVPAALRLRPAVPGAARRATATTTASSRSSSLDLESASSATTATRAILVTTLRDRAGSAVEVRDFAPRFANHGRIYRPTTLIRRVRPLRGEPRDPDRAAPALRLRREPPRAHARQQPPALRAPEHHAAAHHQRADLLRRRRRRRSCSSARSILILGPDETARRVDRRHRARLRRAHARLLERVVAHALDPVRVAGRGDPRRDHAQAVPLRGDRRDRRGAHHVDPRGARQRAQLGLSLLLAARLLLRDPGAEPARRDEDDGGLPLLHPPPRRAAGEAVCSPCTGSGSSPRSTSARRHALAGYRGMGPVRVGNQAYSSRSTTSTAASCSPRRSRSSTGACSTPGGDALFAPARALRRARAAALGPARRRALGAAARARTSTRSRR